MKTNQYSLRRTALTVLAGGTFTLPTTFATAATIGIMAPLSGPVAVVGQDQVDGFMLAVEPGRKAGRPGCDRS